MKRIESIADIRYKAYKEMLTFINWQAETHPEQWVKLTQEYTKKKRTQKERERCSSRF